MDKFIKSTQVQEYINKKLYNFNAGEELAWAWNSNENIIMFGPGGYGKSDAAILFHEFLESNGLVESKPFIMSFGQGMTEEKLLGGIDMKEFQESGEIKYLLQNAFVNNEVVIFEELWDAFPAVLLILKDILQSKCVRMGNQVLPIKTKIVIACTNRSRQEVVEDASTEALMQRFLFEKEVAWENHTPGNYINALKCAAKNFDENIANAVANICSASNTEEYIVSPRTCGKAYKSAMINGIESLRGMYGLSKGLTEYLDVIQKANQSKEIKDKMILLVDHINRSKEEIMSYVTFREFARSFKSLYSSYESVMDMAVTDDLIELQQDIGRQCGMLLNGIADHYNKFVQNPPMNSVPYRFKTLINRGMFKEAYKILR